MIAALFVETDGAYFNLEGIDPWDKTRDARLYEGPHPVVAHPPCQLWVNFAALNYKRYGGEHNKPGNDGGCFASALHSVRSWGGVLEHPAGSHAWTAFDLPRPRRGVGWEGNADSQWPEWVCEVWQSAYGLKARKRTWLYYIGSSEPTELEWQRPTGTHQIGVGFRVNKKPRLRGAAASATPPAFRDALINLARHSRGDRRAA